jgi:hypothetical protein
MATFGMPATTAIHLKFGWTFDFQRPLQRAQRRNIALPVVTVTAW